MEEAARVRCAWAEFKELSPLLTVGGASYLHIIKKKERYTPANQKYF